MQVEHANKYSVSLFLGSFWSIFTHFVAENSMHFVHLCMSGARTRAHHKAELVFIANFYPFCVLKNRQSKEQQQLAYSILFAIVPKTVALCQNIL